MFSSLLNFTVVKHLPKPYLPTQTYFIMAKRLGKFELPNRLVKEEETATEKYAKFIADPFESGYGHTIGNAFRRVLLSSIEGAAISSLKIDGVQHEFQSVDGVVEDITDIVLNLKKDFDNQPQS